uniref:Parvovirus non-structural protein 1 helicase domain-containing protein n=1 Tax=Pittosporum tobira parvo-like virus TaxID=2739860 RepID=A0A6M9BKF0_9VIRU|nr:hypothetical protein 2 [Pittosporum tobira parvo-like virus]
MSLREIFLYSRQVNPEKRYYERNFTDETYYYSIEDSIKVLEEFLLFQCFTLEGVIKFLTDLFNILERRIPKKNCLYVVSEPNGGKNYFFDCVKAALLNSGEIGNFNRFCNFPLQEAPKKRILMWNEPNFEPSSIDTLKMLFAGDSIACKIKHKCESIVTRTPIVVLSNTNVIPDNDIFKPRVMRYYWRVASLLKNKTRKPYPLSIFYLLFKYNILSKNDINFTNEEINYLS